MVDDALWPVITPTPKPASAPARIPIKAKTITFARIESLGLMETSLADKAVRICGKPLDAQNNPVLR